MHKLPGFYPGLMAPDWDLEQVDVELAEKAKEVGVKRFIFSSSCSNYGAGGQDWLNEDSAFNPVTPYGRSKVSVEQDLAKLANDDFSPTFLRSSTAKGRYLTWRLTN